ncbi:phosphoglycerate mutase-like protein [Coniophora puteana RWD-64-598 SS2]|uniref:Phosphoglycerate mutase-like protein n=1 Tax=Coniophora puteana (strain RWD-64-598) TaxID=741705 RepID=A0A5M3MD93_CONPW|nr:phosphoglycerate mutase-like protein [Coniophora puteana RWD-64-598 SS2]EIW77222.1 phosphoglycerate mutase-like protein [Coniophora puteana RWD-64-598 SS2]
MQQNPLDVERYPVAPDGLELEQVNVYVRHGERTPVKVRMNEPPASIPENWAMCQQATRFFDAAGDLLNNGKGGGAQGPFRRAVETSDGRVVDGLCLLGELTDTGRMSTLNYGLALRKLYIDKLGLLPNVLGQEQDVYFRSTNVPRTIESLEYIMHGLYPLNLRKAGVAPSLLVRNRVDENLVSNTMACPRLAALELQFAEAAATLWNPKLASLNDKVSKYIDGKPVKVNGSPRASGLLDTIRAAAAHDIELPSEFRDDELMRPLEDAVVDEWFRVTTEEARKLAMGPLLTELSRKMQDMVVAPEDAPKLLVHSTHDSGIAALLNTLDVYDQRWPLFTAHITFELFKKAAPVEKPGVLQTVMNFWKAKALDDEHYVRLRYDNKNLAMPFCAGEGEHLPGAPEFCTLSAFQKRVRELMPGDWKAECVNATART